LGSGAFDFPVAEKTGFAQDSSTRLTASNDFFMVVK
jgi:hypothetical protein